MNSCHKVVRSIRSTILKLCDDCTKQFVRNAQNCGKTNFGFCIMKTHQLPHLCLCMSFWHSPDLVSADFLVFTKLRTPMKGKRFAMIEKTKEKSKQELLAIPKRAFQKYFEDWNKRWQKRIISEGDKIVSDK